MSYESWHNYGYGICVDAITDKNIERLQTLLKAAPQFNQEVQQWFADQDIQEPVWEDYVDFDEDYRLGLATILKEVIQEAEGIELLACSDWENQCYLLYQPRYPWTLPEAEQHLTEECICQIFSRYISILTDESIPVDYEAVENGG